MVITGPTTLMITLRMIAQIWRRENENRNAQKIADCAGRLYDQVALVLESLIETGTRLSRVRESFDEAMDRMKDGRGNVVKKIEELRTLGAKASRQLPQALMDAVADDNNDGATEAPQAQTM